MPLSLMDLVVKLIRGISSAFNFFSIYTLLDLLLPATITPEAPRVEKTILRFTKYYKLLSNFGNESSE